MLNRSNFSAFFKSDATATIAIWVLTIFHTVAGFCSSAVAQRASAGDARAKSVLEAIRRHGDTTKSFVFEWRDTRSAVSDEETARAMRYRNEAVKSDDPGQREQAMFNARAMIQDQQPGTYRLVVDGARMRFEQSGFEASITDPLAPVPQEMVRTFDGKLGKTLVEESAGRYPRGTVEGTDPTNGLDFVGSLPIVLAIRAAVWVDRNTFVRATAVDGVLENDPMVTLTLSPENNKRRTYTLWCDPARDYHVRRIESHVSSVLRSRFDISYSRHESGLWVPIRWNRISARPDGTIKLQKTSEVTTYSIGGAIAPREFDLSFPPGTWVKDVVSNRSYILLEDGGQRVVTPAEKAAGLSYEQLLEGTPGFLSPRMWWIMFISTLVLIGMLLFVWRSNRRRLDRGF